MCVCVCVCKVRTSCVCVCVLIVPVRFVFVYQEYVCAVLYVCVCTVASRPVSLGPDQPEGWSWTACTAVTHQTATESSPFASPISVIGGHLAES